MEKNRITQLILAIFIALIFISSYVSLTNYNSQQTTISTTPPTYFAQGFSKATIVGYGNSMSFNFTCNNQSLKSTASNIIVENITTLSSNSSVLNFYSLSSSISIEPGSMSAYGIYKIIKNKLNQQEANCTSSFALTIVQLPAIINLSVGAQTQEAQIPIQSRNQTLTLPLTYSPGNSIKVKVSTTVVGNWTVYGPLNILVLK